MEKSKASYAVRTGLCYSGGDNEGQSKANEMEGKRFCFGMNIESEKEAGFFFLVNPVPRKVAVWLLLNSTSPKLTSKGLAIEHSLERWTRRAHYTATQRLNYETT